ncbi:MAG: hypothetical protein ACFFDK_00490 [Promethearchaeota archaeon]
MSVPLKDENKSKFKQGKVHISKEAFRNMITHVLRFGSNALENSVEVMGICLGKVQPNGIDVILVNAIPINHGPQVSNGFSQENYITFKKIEEHYTSQDLHIVGFYLSHPGWGLFFSDIGLKNHRFFQTEQKPYAFCIVFDHTLMGKEENLGFEIYRLDNYLDQMAKDHHKVTYELEPPNTLDYYKWIQKFVEDTQKREPILIKEFNELIDTAPSDLQEIPKSEIEMAILKKREGQSVMKPIISGFQEGSSQFSEIFSTIFETHVGDWTEDVNQGTLNGSELIRDSLTHMKEKVTSGFDKLDGWLNRNLNEIVDGFKGQFYQEIDKQLQAQKELVSQSSNTKSEIISNYDSNLNKNFKNLTTEIENKTQELSDSLKKASLKTSEIDELIKNSSQKISKITDNTNTISNNIKTGINGGFTSFEQMIDSEIKKLNDELNRIKEDYSKISNFIKKFQNVANNLKEF